MRTDLILLWLSFTTSFLIYMLLSPRAVDNHPTMFLGDHTIDETPVPGQQWMDAPFNYSHLEPAFQQCLDTTPPDVTPRRARFAIVQSKNTGYTGKDFDLATASMRCYARRHQGLFFVDSFNSERYPSQHIFYSRWISFRDRYWHEAEWLLGVDGDVVPVGFHNDVMKVLDNVHDADVVLHTRENYEVRAAFVAFRTRSKFARCFLDQWIRMGRTVGENYDNGDLLDLTLQLLYPDLLPLCRPLRTDYGRYMSCFSHLYTKLLSGDVHAVPLKILFPLEGFMRSFERPDYHYPEWSHHCLHNDIFLHGWKVIGEYFHDEDVYSCHKYPPQTLLPACYRDHLAMDEARTLELAKTCCYWHYKGCHQNGTNVCREQSHCQASSVGRSGAGVCSDPILYHLPDEKEKETTTGGAGGATSGSV